MDNHATTWSVCERSRLFSVSYFNKVFYFIKKFHFVKYEVIKLDFDHYMRNRGKVMFLFNEQLSRKTYKRHLDLPRPLLTRTSGPV